MRARLRWLGVIALLVVACGDDREDERDRRGTREKTSGDEAPAEDLAWLPTTAARPLRDDDLVVRVLPPSPSARISRARIGRVPIRVELRNRSSEPVRVAPAWTQVSVLEGGLLVRGCANLSPQPLDAAIEAIGAGESVFTSVPLPCALMRPSTYTVVVVVLTPRPEPGAPRAPEDARAAGSGELIVEDAPSR